MSRSPIQSATEALGRELTSYEHDAVIAGAAPAELTNTTLIETLRTIIALSHPSPEPMNIGDRLVDSAKRLRAIRTLAQRRIDAIDLAKETTS